MGQLPMQTNTGEKNLNQDNSLNSASENIISLQSSRKWDCPNEAAS